MNSTTPSLPTSYGGAARRPSFGAALRGRCRRAGLALWRALEAHGRARALRELGALHERWETADPELARQLRGASGFLRQAPHR